MFRKELTYYFSTPIAYIVLGIFFLAVALFLWVIPGQWNIVDSGYADARGLFELCPWLLMLLCPALTMRLFAEERNSGTWQLLRSKNISLTKIVTGKFMAAWTVTVIGLVPMLVHYILIYYMAEPVGNVDGGQFMGSWLGLVMLSMSFTAIGILCATFSTNQIVCFLVAVVVSFSLYWLVIQDHYSSISRGVVDLRDMLFFVSLTAVCVISSIYIIDKITRK